ncbi:serine/threonine-protein kinase Nek6 [Strongylocentrotus purpuratus]|uniref:non-specific serine/threonine protein kinase n=1 Tax=Strongylocentrotus purpuratus TaxID=7668 RepID=A0A7M7PF98_STRPU|nr:serine/threonine-protein kinase Nek6 [Strongylocentrotus purpuratus]
MECYDKITTLGQGGGGAVYLVRHQISKRLLALKKIQLDEKRKTRTRDAVEREAKILSQLRHPHIVTYHDSFFEEQPESVYLCIAQDYCDGGNLDERIQTAKHRGKPFDEGRIMQWFIQLVMAVQYIHSKKILHRDLKTQNVFLTKSDVVKLGDFGISRTLEHTVDKAKTCVGTPCYLSPEVCQDQPYNNKSDVWALGCLLYEVCAFEPAFDAHNLLSLYYKIVKGDNPTIPSTYSTDLQDLLTFILEKDPDKRPSATTILSQDYVQYHLSNFIAEKELLQQQLATTTTKPQTGSSPIARSKVINVSSTLRNRPMSASHRTRASLQTTQTDRPPPRSKSSLGMLPSMPQTCTGDAIKKSPGLPPIIRPPLEPSESGDYPDDFDSSDEERERPAKNRTDGERPLVTTLRQVSEMEVEVPEECVSVSNSDEDISKPISIFFFVHFSDIPEELEVEEDAEESKKERRTERIEEEGEGEEEYASDFEEEDEVLEGILSNARTAANVEVHNTDQDDSFEDSANLSDDITSCRQLLADECRGVLGNDIFSEIESKIRENRGKDLDPDQLRLQFEEAIGSERMETCYLLSELLSEVHDAESRKMGTIPVS